MLRIMRKGVTVKELQIPDHKLETIKHIQDTVIYKGSSRNMIKDVLEHSLCCICDTGIPSVVLEIDLQDGFKKIEYYCPDCLKNVYEKEPEPEDKDELAAKYNCIRVSSDQMPRRNVLVSEK